MSNASIVTPFGIAAVCVIGAAAFVLWLAEETPEDRQADSRAREERRREIGRRHAERLEVAVPGRTTVPLTVSALNLPEPDSLVRSAESLGYVPEPLARPGAPLGEQPYILLKNDRGERLALSRDASNRLVLSTAGSEERIQAVVRRHTVDRALEHLRGRGMEVRVDALPGGGTRIMARETKAAAGDGAALIDATVHRDGTAILDIDRVRGGRCSRIAADFAKAVGGEIVEMKKKPAWFQLPGEPARTGVKV